MCQTMFFISGYINVPHYKKVKHLDGKFLLRIARLHHKCYQKNHIDILKLLCNFVLLFNHVYGYQKFSSYLIP
jgi:hypothetical protein